MNYPKLLDDKNNQKQECKGLLFRYTESTYLSQTTGCITQRRQLRLLKRKSCPGCEECGWQLEILQEDMYCGYPIMEQKFEHGAIYMLGNIPGAPDWETGYIEEWDWDFTKVEEKK